MTAHVAVLLKAPRAGHVKTRLAAKVGDAAALAIYRELAGRALAAVDQAGLPATVWYDPPDALAAMQTWLGARRAYRPQPAGDLGARLAAAAAEAGPGTAWLAIGGDCPAVSGALLSAAADALAGADVVAGPSEDGGYWLIGARAPVPDLWSGMPWSSAALLAATRRRVAGLGLRLALLPRLADVDTAADARAAGLL